jgi:hypothetical protein
MLRRGKFIGLVSPLIIIFLLSLFIPGKSLGAAENEGSSNLGAVVKDKVSRSAPPCRRKKKMPP